MEGDMNIEDVFRFMMQHSEDIDWDAWKAAEASDDKKEAIIDKIRDGIKYQMGKIHRSKKTSKGMNEVITEKLAEKKMFIPSALMSLFNGAERRSFKVPYYKEVARLEAGQAFGELAIMTNQPRTATCVCVNDCTFAVLNKKDY